MKKLIFAAILLAAGAIAAQETNNVSLKYKNFSLAFIDQPQSDGKLLPLIDGVAGNEHFGIHFAKADSMSPVIEILDGNNLVVRTLSVNDLIGKGPVKEEPVLPSPSVKPRRVAHSYPVRLPQGDVQVILKAIATGDESGGDQQLVVTVALKSDAPLNAALRLTFPFSGIAESVDRGFVLASNSGNAALAVSVFPGVVTTKVGKSTIVVSSGLQSTVPSSETAMLWLVIKGIPTSSGSSPTDAKTQARKVMQDNTLGNDEPRLVVVNTADKEKLAQADTASYTLVCANIGSGEATDVVLGNPIPKGARYVEGSATTEGTVFNVDRPANLTDVQQLKWLLASPLKPGEERIVSFKVVLQ